MSDARNDLFQDPQRVAINRVYTRKGDRGSTSLVGGQQVPKADVRIDTYGAVDELNAFVGVAIESLRALADDAMVHDVTWPGGEATDADDGAGRRMIPVRQEARRLLQSLVRIQHQLFNLGSILATLPEDVHPKQPRVVEGDVTWLEAEMDRCNGALSPLRSFVLPGGTRANADLHVCRTVCRRVERLLCRLTDASEVDPVALRYVNRLSDAFFVWSRWVVVLQGADEVLWQPNRASGDGEG